MCICVDLRKLNDSFLDNPFPSPSIDEVLESVKIQEVYSFTNGFSGYHDIIIKKEHQHTTTFVTEWGCFKYTVMPFGINNSPSIFSRIVVVAFKGFIHKFIEVYFDEWTMFRIIKGHNERLIMMLE